MARKDTTLARNINFTATRQEWTAPQPVPMADVALGITIDVTGWNAPTASLTVGLETSPTGTSWTPYCAMTISGAPTTNPDGSPRTQAVFTVNRPTAGVFVKAYAFTNGVTVRLPVSLVEIT